MSKLTVSVTGGAVNVAQEQDCLGNGENAPSEVLDAGIPVASLRHCVSDDLWSYLAQAGKRSYPRAPNVRELPSP